MAVDINDGILPYLDASVGQHNLHGSKDFKELLAMRNQPRDGFTRVTIQAMAAYFGVHRHTMQDWVARYNKEHAQDDNRPPIQSAT